MRTLKRRVETESRLVSTLRFNLPEKSLCQSGQFRLYPVGSGQIGQHDIILKPD